MSLNECCLHEVIKAVTKETQVSMQPIARSQVAAMSQLRTLGLKAMCIGGVNGYLFWEKI